ncbi:hypothetical protein LOTGIDRAFT_237364 [Lottia gigantea]|uniref:Uncharacterized protein n=1 Tax=Lottia gigantea TaxID=225164 RepID=V4AJP8_LOTGI|nr:hypothetical protein LOTGIDRAFT_237364 [Lottia gigantea]ESP04394.1 hypothetical protein LOTGIDRAFT_237364 [Lottia gigantea]
MAALSSCKRITTLNNFNKLLLIRNSVNYPDRLNKRRCYSQLIRGKTVKIGCACGFWGDTAVAAPQLIYGSNVDYIMFDYLSEITMSLLTAAKHKNPALGYAPDFVQICMAPFIKDIKKKGIKIISNAGGVNPMGCGQALQDVCDRSGVDLNIAVIQGDDLMPKLGELEKLGITDMHTGKQLPSSIHSMNAYFGAGPIARALDLGADVVITGRCADSALALAPLIHNFQWTMDQFDLLAAGSLAGHLIECGPQVTGGIFTDWHKVTHWDNIGFPIAEVGSDGHCIITKPHGTGGLVSLATVAEQLLYEVGDPSHYFLPDVVCDFTDVRLEQVAEDRVIVLGARGKPPSGELKVSATYADGFRSTAVVCVGGPHSKLKVEKTAHAIIKRCQRIFQQLSLPDFKDINIEILGTEHMYGPNSLVPKGTREAVLWLAVQHDEKKALEFFSREVAPAGTGMAPGLCNIVGGRPKISAILKLFSFLYPRDSFKTTIHMNGELKEEYKCPSIPTVEYTQESYKGREYEEDTNQTTLTTGDKTYKLVDLAYTRSGDKGNDANIAVIARDPAFLPYITETLTSQAVRDYFKHVFPSVGLTQSQVKRYSVPGISGYNYVLHKSLGGGGIASLRSDAQGKAYGQMLLDFEIHNMPVLDSIKSQH